MKRRERGDGRRRSKEGVADITSYGNRAPCLQVMPRLCLRRCSFSFPCVCTMSDLSQGCQIFRDSLFRCVLLWLIHKEAIQMDDVAVLRELNLITVSETKTIPGNKELTRSPAWSTRGGSTNSTKREIQYYPEPRHKSTDQTVLFLSSVWLIPSFSAASLSFHLPVRV